jgi:cytochrome c biogenesis protein CcdA
VSVLALSFAAGTLSALSPCVLPLLPVVVAAALRHHRHGPLAVAAGFVLSSAAFGLAVAALGFSLGVSRDTIRAAAGALMVAAGVVLVVPRLREAFAAALAPLASSAGGATGRLPAGLAGQVLLGAVLGVVWTPCTGPTLAAAITLASRSEDLGRAAAVMLVFGAGAMVPLLGLAYGARRAMAVREAWLARAAAIGRLAMGAVLVVVGGLTLAGADKAVETWLVDRMPGWLLDLTTSI